MRAIPLLFALVLAPVIAAQEPAPPGGGLLFARFGSYLDALRMQAGIPGLSAAIVGETEIVWERAYGYHNVERSLAVGPHTPFHLDGLTQIFTASLVLRCAEEGRLSLNDRIGQYAPGDPFAGATLGEVLAHVAATPAGLVYSYDLERLDGLKAAVRACTGDSYRETLANLLDRLAMIDAVPGPDAVSLRPPAEGIPEIFALQRYTLTLDRVATPYTVVAPGRVAPTGHPATTLGAAGGLIASARDLAQFDLALKNGLLVLPDTLAVAWSTPVDANGLPLPHGLGWFVQNFNGQRVVWQFGMSANASSSLVLAVPGRGVTLILLANSDGLARWFPLVAGDVTVSPFARVFLGLVVP